MKTAIENGKDDLADSYLPDCKTECTHSADNLMIIDGFRIKPEEVESVLQKHPAVAEAVVTLDNGKYARRLVAWVVCKTRMDIEVSEIRQYIEKSLSSHIVPSVFIFMKHLPVDANGKIDRTALLFDALDYSSSCDGPRNMIEKIVADIWKTIFDQEIIGIQYDFLDLGGDSIQAGLISLKIREYFKVEIPLVMFFEDMTVRQLAALIEDQIKSNRFVPSNKIAPIDRNCNIPLSPSQEVRLFYEFSLDASNIQHTNPSVWFCIKLSGDLDRDALEKSFNYVINRHEVFRTSIWPEISNIAPKTNKWNMVCQLCSTNPRLFLPKVVFKQYIQSYVTMDITYYDISEYSDDERYIEFNVISSEFIQKRYMYESPPLTRAALIRTAATEHVLIVAASHLIADAVSISIYEGELAHVYNALVNKQPINLQNIDVQYFDYVAWQRSQLETGSFDSMKSYWQKQFEGYIPIDVTLLPFADIVGSESDNDFSIDTKYYYHPFPNELDKAIRKFAGYTNLTVFSIAMTGFMLYLYCETGKSDLGLFTFFANRTRHEVENTIGLFATGNIIRVIINSDDSFYQCVKAVSESLNGAMTNQAFMIVPTDSRTNKSLYDLVIHRPITCELLFLKKCVSFSDLDVEKVFVGQNKSEHALKYLVVDSSESLSFMFQYNLDLFDRADIKKMAIRTESIIKEIITNPSSIVFPFIYGGL